MFYFNTKIYLNLNWKTSKYDKSLLNYKKDNINKSIQNHKKPYESKAQFKHYLCLIKMFLLFINYNSNLLDVNLVPHCFIFNLNAGINSI